jgi:hypothetical protein
MESLLALIAREEHQAMFSAWLAARVSSASWVLVGQGAGVVHWRVCGGLSHQVQHCLQTGWAFSPS